MYKSALWSIVHYGDILEPIPALFVYDRNSGWRLFVEVYQNVFERKNYAYNQGRYTSGCLCDDHSFLYGLNRILGIFLQRIVNNPFLSTMLPGFA